MKSVPENERAARKYPFIASFDDSPGSPEFVGLDRSEAEDLARRDGLSVRVLELPAADQPAWTADRRSTRVNFVVEHGRVIRAAIF